MMYDDNLPHITFVIHDLEGGVATMNHQIIENADFDKQFNVHIILWSKEGGAGFKSFKDAFTKARDVAHFRFSAFDNYHYALKRFNTLLNKWPGLIVANDGLELDAVRHFGTCSVLCSIIHDFYNLKLAFANLDLIDHFICHTETYATTLKSSPVLRSRVAYLPHGVEVVKDNRREGEGARKLRVLSISRLISSKGVLLFEEVEYLLVQLGVEVEWVVIGSGELDEELKAQWTGKSNIAFHKPDTRKEVFAIASTCDVFISPSTFEGYGIALLEAMSCGLVPIIYALPLGVYADLPPTVGFSVELGNVDGLATSIARLDKDRALLSSMGEHAHRLVKEKYDVVKTSDQFLAYFEKAFGKKYVDKKAIKKISNFGLFDRAYFPNRVVRIIKKLRSGLGI